MPLVRDARVVVDQAATEMVRVGDVLDSAEAVSATVDSASRLAYRAFANPVVKVLAYGTGTGQRRCAGSSGGPARTAGARVTNGRPASGGSRRDATRPVGARRRTAPTAPPPEPGAAVTPAPDGLAVMRRPLWLAAGAAVGVGGTVWTRLAQRMRLVADRGAGRHRCVDQGARSTRRTGRGSPSTRVRDAADAGRTERNGARTTCGRTSRRGTARRGDRLIAAGGRSRLSRRHRATRGGR